MSVFKTTLYENDNLVIEEVVDDSIVAAFENSDFDIRSTSENDGNKSVNSGNDIYTSNANISALSCDEELLGYDKLAGEKWIYPINYPQRDYQFNIINAAIAKNTLVSLPTGLGKTFIAAVLMYNFYRWYPSGKIVFTAPTRPLISQQMEACYNIIAIPQEDTIEMTGSMSSHLRKENWISKRVFFATPQVVCNDIKSGICPAEKIRCLVIDEAHRAKSNYAYCQIISLLNDMDHRTYRVLALSATPGSRIEDAIKVVQNLQIAHLELRSEKCIDVARYCQSRKIKTVLIELGPELTRLRQQYIEIIDGYARKLKQMKLLPPNLGNLSKGRIAMLYKEFKNKGLRHPQSSHVMKDMTQLMTLYHGLELLVKHGSRSFLKFFDEHAEKGWIQADDRLTAILERLRDDLGVDPLSLNTDFQPDGTVPDVPENINFGHPKFAKLKEIMIEHFENAQKNGQDTRAIVFCEYHETVKLVHCLLLQCRPLIKPRKFVGQGVSGRGGSGGSGGSGVSAAMSQGEQRRALAQFRAGGCTALVATCVAEEGLDLGGVDLILCFDVASRSPVRLVQRCGRTGRRRSGQVYFLVTEGKEHQTLQDSMRQRDGLYNAILHSKEVKNNLYKRNPRMIPRGFTPECQKKYINVKKKEAKRRKNNTRNIEDEKQKEPTPRACAASNLNKDVTANMTANDSSKVIPQKQHHQICDDKPEPQTTNTCNVRETELSKSDLPIKKPGKTTTRMLSSETKNNLSPHKNRSHKNKHPATVKNNCDIRSLFSKGKSTQEYSKALNNLQVQGADMPAPLLDLLVNLRIENNSIKTCYICSNICDCQMIYNLRKLREKPDVMEILDREPNFLDINLIDQFDSASILKCLTRKTPLDASTIIDVQKDNMNSSILIDLTYSEHEQQILEKGTLDNTDSKFDIGGIDDIFADDNSECNVLAGEDQKEICDISNSNHIKNTSFALIDSVDELFCDVSESEEDFTTGQLYDSCSRNTEKETVSVRTRSPSILSGSHTSVLKIQQSPILGFQSKRTEINKSADSSPSSNLSNSMLTVTQTIDLINANNSTNSCNNVTKYDRSKSPILYTQADKKRIEYDKGINESMNSLNNNVIYISDSDSDEITEGKIHMKDTARRKIEFSNSIQMKRKSKSEADTPASSPYFSKKLKLDKCVDNSRNNASNSIQEKVLAALTSNDLNRETKFQNNVNNFNVTVLMPKSLKENIYQNKTKPGIGSKCLEHDIKQEKNSSYSEYKYVNSSMESGGIAESIERKFKVKSDKLKLMRNNIVNEFLDLEAELSEDGGTDSGDELLNDSAGSIVDFITDNDVTHTDVDMQALYLKSVKSPFKRGAFKIPKMPKMKDNTGVFSQFVQEDTYEMDSFCVDSHVGLTQAHDLSELELAEIILKQKRKISKRSRIRQSVKESDGSSTESSPEMKSKTKKAKRYNVLSDSDDDSQYKC